ncbi:hypothetical protein [Vibrio furnissii]|uniref:hypothetical protein n=1 Tax=Vibrio furnissii TaxID=29494 RepID=UPI000E04DE26|nr:hypothetical protein [Vibrio furnissii]SUQ35275.1 Uncharacterised protein [Vibrio furnissii]
MKYDFDEYVSREKTDSLTVDGWREYLFSGQSEFAMRYPAEGLINLWVADMAFATPEPILQAIRDRLDRKYSATLKSTTKNTMRSLAAGVSDNMVTVSKRKTLCCLRALFPR